MNEQRRFPRYPVELHAVCYPADGSPGSQHILVSEISMEGMAVKLYADHNLAGCTRFYIEADVPDRVEPIRAELEIRWSNDIQDGSGYGVEAGGSLLDIADEDKQLLLAYGRENWQRRQQQ